MPPAPDPLPIDALRDELIAAVREHRRFVLSAPTGSGKSTRVPGMLLDGGAVGEGEIVVLQPRRIAARMLARRVAGERGDELGGEVGYQVRLERKVSARTRIRFVTEGLLLRQLVGDPRLRGVGAILFDEFHERHLDGDLILARALQLQRAHRPDLLLGVMSATLSSEALAAHLDPCAVLASEGRTFPVEISYHPPRRQQAVRGAPAEAPVWDQAAAAVAMAAQDDGGDILVFMPGAYEINRTVRALESTRGLGDALICPLHGELPPEAQQLAVEAGPRRKVIVATNVAETSLTIPGVTVVVDSGLARIPAHDPHRGLNTLLVQKISQASADQRAGRAGRTRPGRALRLWSEADHRNRPAFETPEIARLDLAEAILLLHAGGVDDLDALPWFEPPPPQARARAEQLLHDLGALDADGRLTDVGQRMAAFPLHPRYARWLLAAADLRCVQAVIRLAALAQGRSLLTPVSDRRTEEARTDLLVDSSAAQSDLLVEARAFAFAVGKQFRKPDCARLGIHAQAARQAQQVARQLTAIAEREGLPLKDDREDLEPRLFQSQLLAFADHLALRRDRGTLRVDLVHGRRGELRRQTQVREAPLVVAVEIEERDARGELTLLLDRLTAVDPAWLRELFPDEVRTVTAVQYDADERRVVAATEEVFRGLVLARKEAAEPPAAEAAALLAREVHEGRLSLKQWTEAVETWIARVNFVARHWPEYAFSPIGEEERRLLLEELCAGATRYKEIRDRDPWRVLRKWLGPEQEPMLAACAPERLSLPSGASARVRYPADGEAIASATVQQLYDAPARLTLGPDRRVTARVEILAPNRRPVQITDDLGAFWENSYQDVKKQLKGRYPKHEWR